MKDLVVEDKWIATVDNAVRDEVERITQQLAGRVQELETRYSDPLPALETRWTRWLTTSVRTWKRWASPRRRAALSDEPSAMQLPNQDRHIDRRKLTDTC